MFASTADLILKGVLKRCLLPIVYLARGETSALHKTVGMLWQLTLIIGPDLLPLFATRVRSILTDGGVERLTANMPPMLSDYYWYIKAQMPRRAPLPRRRLFPRAVHLLGWKHQFDLIIRKGLGGVA